MAVQVAPAPPSERAHVLVVDGDKGLRRSLRRALTTLGCDVQETGSDSRAILHIETAGLDVLFAGPGTPGIGGIEMARRAKRVRPDLHVVLVADDADLVRASDAPHANADDFLPRHFRRDQLRVILNHVLKHDVHHGGRHLIDSGNRLPGLVGNSQEMDNVYRTVRRVAPSEESVLITGASGTGKELAARAIHFWSPNHAKPFVCVNCAALTDSLVENELFGHEPGSFTGALGRTTGLIEQANGGTLFLDEIGNASPALQTSLLRVLQENEIRRVGSGATVKVNVRVVAATNGDLRLEIKRGLFREDLYYRLCVVPIHMPPLRARPDDIPLLVDHFLSLCGAGDRTFDDDALAALQRYPWPGNVRELQNLVRRLRVLVLDTVIQRRHLPPPYRDAANRLCPPVGTLRRAMESFERNYIETLLHRVGGNVAEAARQAGMARPRLHEKLRRFGISANAYRGGDGQASMA